VQREPSRKPVIWIASSRDDLRGFPEDVKDRVGHALWFAQTDRRHDSARLLKGFGDAGVLEVIESHEGNAYRAVYTIRYAGYVYVLHLLPEEVEAGPCDADARDEPSRVPAHAREERLRGTERRNEEMTKSKKPPITLGSGNVFADIAARDPEEMLVKAQLSGQIVDIIRSRGLTQTAAAKLLGVDQPKVSQLFRGDIRQYTIDRLVRFVTLLQHDVEIRVGAKRRRGKGRVIVEAA
jgi:predicted XRE-type DNA-binding protein/phage-related protein